MDGASATFPLAPMSALIRWLTCALLVLPAALLLSALAFDARVLVVPGVLVAVLYVGVWLYFRPSCFVVAPRELRIVWPTRTRIISSGRLESAREISAGEFCQAFGLAVRIGVGGLWGGFGWLWTRRRGLVDFYISRTDGLVLVELRSARPLLITPERPAEFVRAVGVVIAER